MALGTDNHAYSGQGGQTDGQVDEDLKGQMAREHGSHQIQDGQTNGQVKEQVKGQITKDQEAIKDKVQEVNVEVGRWGLFCCTPSCMQWVNRPQIVIFCLCWFYLIQGFAVNGVNNVNTSTLERRFNLPSSLVSLISSSYDIMAGICVLPVTFLCARAHYPRMLAFASLIMGAGSMVMSLPHFTSPKYDLAGSVSDKCDLVGNGTDALCTKDEEGLSNYLYVFMLGQFLHGIGGATLYSLGVVYIDDNVSTESSPLYNGFIFACSALGPAIGYIVGGRMLQVYVDFDKVDTTNLGITPEDPRWVGAWWVGFFVASFLFITVFLFLIPYPKETINAPKVREQRVSMAHNDGSEVIASRDGFGVGIRDLPVAMWLLVKNPVNMLVTLGAVTEGLLTSGFATFMPKFLQNQYGLTAGAAAMLGGIISVPGAAGGQFLGGLVCKVLKLKVRGLLRMCLGLSLACSLCGFGLLINCGPEPVAGVSVKYGNRSIEISENELTNPCNAGCNCGLQSYEPLCGQDNVQYFSPCHAGCQNSFKEGNKKFYTDCSCIPASNVSTVVAVDGKCPTSCNLIWIFLPFFFLICLLTFTGTVPGVVASLRCVPDSQRPLAFGIKWIFIRFLGTVPGPLFFGLLYDSTCVLWQEKCSQKGSCWIYDNQRLSVSLFFFCFGIKMLSSLFFLGANLCYRPPPEEVKVNGGFTSDSSGGATVKDSTPQLIQGGSTGGDGVETRL